MKWYPLTNRDWFLLLAVFIVGYISTEVQQYFIPEEIRPFTYLLAVFLLFLAFFCMVKPAEPVELGKFLATILGMVVAVIIVIEDFLIRHNNSYKVAIVLAGAVLIPLLAGYLYRVLAKNRLRHEHKAGRNPGPLFFYKHKPGRVLTCQ